MIKLLDNVNVDEKTKKVLSHCVFNATSDKLDKILAEYHNNRNKKLYGYFSNGLITALIGLTQFENEIEISHLAVGEESRLKGVGKKLVEFIVEIHPSERVYLETDDDAVGFYKSLGFHVEYLGEKYPGFPRYLCTSKKDSLG